MKVAETEHFRNAANSLNERDAQRAFEVVEFFKSRDRFTDICRRWNKTQLIEDTPIWKWNVSQSVRLLYRYALSPRGSTIIVVLDLLKHDAYDELRRRDRLHVLQKMAADSLLDPTTIALMGEADAEEHQREEKIPSTAIGLRQGLVNLVWNPGTDYVLESKSATRELARLERSHSSEVAQIGEIIGTLEINAEIDVEVAGLKICSIGEPGWRRTEITSAKGETSEWFRHYQRPSGIDANLKWSSIRSSGIAAVDPYVRMDTEQETLLDSLADPFTSFPMFIDGPAGSGKTTVLLAILKGVLSNRELYGEQLDVKLITVNERHLSSLRKSVELYLTNLSDEDQSSARAFASKSCQSLDSFFLGLIPERERNEFARERKVLWSSFSKWSLKHFFTSGSETWSAFRTLINGDTIGRDEGSPIHPSEFDDLVDWFSSLNENRRSGMEVEDFISSLRVLSRYRKWKEDEGLWDDGDLTRAVARQLEDKEFLNPSIDLLMLDEAQDLTPDQIRVLIRCGAAFKYELGTRYDHGLATRPITPLPFLFAADDLQTINPSGFRWSSLTSIFYEETRAILNTEVGVSRPRTQLLKNYRMSPSLNYVASRIRRWIDPSVTPVSNSGAGATAGPWFGPDEDVESLLDIVDVILVPGEQFGRTGTEDLSRDSDPLLLSVGRHVQDKVLTVQDAKGQEWSSALLVGFAKFARQARTSSEIRYARQICYVAATRARDVCVWIDDAEDREWFWESDDELSPSTLLENWKAVDDVKMLANDQDSETAFAEASERLRSSVESDISDSARTGLARNSAAQFSRFKFELHAQAAREMADFFAGVTRQLALESFPDDLKEIGGYLALSEGALDSFSRLRGTLKSECGALKIGAILACVERRDAERSLEIIRNLSSEELSKVESDLSAIEGVFNAALEELCALQATVFTQQVESTKLSDSILHQTESLVASLQRLRPKSQEFLAIARCLSELRAGNYVDSLVQVSQTRSTSRIRAVISPFIVGQWCGYPVETDEKQNICLLLDVSRSEVVAWLELKCRRYCRELLVKRMPEIFEGTRIRQMRDDQIARFVVENLGLCLEKIEDVFNVK